MSDTTLPAQSAAAYRRAQPEFAAWASGYGVIQHADVTQARISELAEQLVSSGRARSCGGSSRP